MRTPYSKGFHVLSIVTLLVGVVLIWIGAAVTTTDAGMAFSDWPLSQGSINPPSWLYVQPQFLEHSHRLLASTVGFLVLGMFIWQWSRDKQRAWVPWVLVLVFLYIVPGVQIADAMGKGSESSLVLKLQSLNIGSSFLWISSGMGLGAVFAWLFYGLLGSRWDSLTKLTAAALVLVVLQALLGGLRVLAVSDPFGMAHGTLGQLFYCLLIAIALFTSKDWNRNLLIVPKSDRGGLVGISTLLFGAISLQLLFGAIVRHSQRQVLAATDVFTTGGALVPPTDPFDVFSIFMHKAWGVVVLILTIVTALQFLDRFRNLGWQNWLPKLLILLPLIQVALGVSVLMTTKKFWVTNIHVINGLSILAISFVLCLQAWRSQSSLGEVAQSK